jgi:hypothetical protein
LVSLNSSWYWPIWRCVVFNIKKNVLP